MLLQFAQGRNAGADEGQIAFIAIGCGCIGVVLLVAIFFLLTLQRALARCRPRNRTMEPAMVWLNLIPLVSLVWQFITVARVAESLQQEFRSRGLHHRTEDFGYGVGLAACILSLCGIIPIIGPFLSIAGLICFIIYWVKIAGYSSRLARDGYDDEDDFDDEDPPRGRRRDDDDDDDRPRRRRQDDDDDDDDRRRR